MKQYLVLFSILLSSYAMAQLPTEIKQEDQPFEKMKLRHVKGKSGLDAGYGYTAHGPYYGLGFVHFLSNTLIINPTLRYETGKINYTGFNQYTLFLSLQKNVFKYDNYSFINVGLSPVFTYQMTDNEIFKKQETFYPVGVSIDVNIELFISNGVVLRFEASEVFSNDKFGFPRFLAGGGLRFYF